MSLAEEVKNQMERARKKIVEERDSYRERRQKKRIEAAVPKKVAKVLSEVIAGIKRAGEGGYSHYEVGCYEHDSEEDVIETMAYRRVMELLRDKPYEFQVTEEKTTNGHAGFSELGFYQFHSWVISWE